MRNVLSWLGRLLKKVCMLLGAGLLIYFLLGIWGDFTAKRLPGGFYIAFSFDETALRNTRSAIEATIQDGIVSAARLSDNLQEVGNDDPDDRGCACKRSYIVTEEGIGWIAIARATGYTGDINEAVALLRRCNGNKEPKLKQIVCIPY